MVRQVRPLAEWEQPKKVEGSQIVTNLHDDLCKLVSHLEQGGQIIHQSICLDELNLLFYDQALFAAVW